MWGAASACGVQAVFRTHSLQAKSYVSVAEVAGWGWWDARKLFVPSGHPTPSRSLLPPALRPILRSHSGKRRRPTGHRASRDRAMDLYMTHESAPVKRQLLTIWDEWDRESHTLLEGLTLRCAEFFGCAV